MVRGAWGYRGHTVCCQPAYSKRSVLVASVSCLGKEALLKDCTWHQRGG
jgi:hypothetical protein